MQNTSCMELDYVMEESICPENQDSEEKRTDNPPTWPSVEISSSLITTESEVNKSSGHEIDDDDDHSGHRCQPTPGDNHDIRLNEMTAIQKTDVNDNDDIGVVSSKNVEKPTKPPNSFCSTRYLVTYLASLGFLTGHMGRVTLSVCITAMVNSTSNHELYEMKHNESDSTYEFCEGKGYMNGSVKEQGWTYPVFFAFMSRWAPPSERSRLVAIGTSGVPLGQVIGQPIAGLWASSEFAGGWPSAFYFSGTVGVIWFILWMSLAYPSPSTHPRISSKEREFILLDMPSKKTAVVYPWKSMLTSVPVLAVCVADFSLLWILYLFTTNLPIYLKGVLRFDIRETGFLAAVPFMFYWLIWTVGGRFTDFFIARTQFSRTTIRKLVTSLAFIPSSVLLVIIGYVGCDTVLALVTLTLGLSISGLAMSGASMCQLDFAPRYAGIISAVVNMFAATSGFLAPILVGRFTENQADPRGWRIVFWTTAGIVMFGLVFFLTFGTAEVQPWAREAEDVNENGTTKKARPDK